MLRRQFVKNKSSQTFFSAALALLCVLGAPHAAFAQSWQRVGTINNSTVTATSMCNWNTGGYLECPTGNPRVSSGAVSIGGTTPDASAVLDLTSTTKGFLPPRMTTAQKTAIATPATGLTVYDTTTNTLNVYNGTAWGGVGGGGAISSLSDVAITSIANNDILRYDSVSSKWKNVNVGTAMGTTTMMANWPDAIECISSGYKLTLYLDGNNIGTGQYVYRYINSPNTINISFTAATGALAAQAGLIGYDCVTNSWSIAQLYAAGQAFNFIGSSLASAAAPAGGVQFNNGAGVLAGDTALIWDNTNKRLGIGTATPGTFLDINSSTATANEKITTSFSGGLAQLLLSNTGVGGENWGLNVGNTATGTLGAKFGIADGSNYRMVIDSTGNVGIGTASPLDKLDVAGVVRSSGSSGNIQMFNDSSTVSAINANTGARLDLRSGNATWMSISNTGNVGIGTTSPAYQLDNVKTDGATSGGRDYIARNYLTVNPASASSAYKSAQQNSLYTSGAVNYTGDIMAGYNFAMHNGTGTLAAAFGGYDQAYNGTTGTITSAYGAYGIAENAVGGTITNAFGGQFIAQNDTGGTIANAYGSNSVAQNLGTKNVTTAMYGINAYTYISGASGTTPKMIGGNFNTEVNNAGATATNAYGVVSAVSQTAGTITNAYGVYTGAIQGTNKWAFYQSGTENNYFGGNVGIGTTAPQSSLHVTGEVQVSSSGAGCSASNAGAMRYSAGAMTFCNGSAWVPFKLASCTAGGSIQCTLDAPRSTDDANFVAGNIKNGVNILGVTGSYTGGGGGIACTKFVQGSATFTPTAGMTLYYTITGGGGGGTSSGFFAGAAGSNGSSQSGSWTASGNPVSIYVGGGGGMGGGGGSGYFGGGGGDTDSQNYWCAGGGGSTGILDGASVIAVANGGNGGTCNGRRHGGFGGSTVGGAAGGAGGVAGSSHAGGAGWTAGGTGATGGGPNGAYYGGGGGYGQSGAAGGNSTVAPGTGGSLNNGGQGGIAYISYNAAACTL